MAILGVDDFKSKLKGGGARSNLFNVKLAFPNYVVGDAELSSFMVKAAALPASIISPIEVNFRGRKLKIAGDRTFDAWTVTVINDTGFEVRDAMEAWMNGINAHQQNTGLNSPEEYQADLTVQQLDKDGSVLKEYNLRGCWPTNISQIDLSYENENQIEEFTVEFQVQYWEARTTS